MSPAPSNSERVGGGVLLAFTLAALPIGLLQMPMAVYLPNYYASYTGMGLTLVGALFSVSYLLSIGADALIGIGMDLTRTRHGRYRVWLAGGGALCAWAGYAAFFPTRDAGVAWLALLQVLLLTGFSAVQLSLSAWGTVIAPDYHERSRLYAWQQFAVVAVTVLILVAGAVLPRFHPDAGLTPIVHAVGWAVAVLGPLGVLCALLRIGESARYAAPLGKVRWKTYRELLVHPNLWRVLLANGCVRSAPALAGALYFFFFAARGFSEEKTGLLLLFYMGFGLAGALTCGRIAQRLGKRRTLRLMVVINIGNQLALPFIPMGNLSVALLLMAVGGFANSSFPGLVTSMAADVADEIRVATAEDRTAIIYSLMNATIKFGVSLALGAAYPFLQWVGYDGNAGAANSIGAVRSLEWCFALGPALLQGVALLALRSYRLDAAQHRRLRDLLRERPI